MAVEHIAAAAAAVAKRFGVKEIGRAAASLSAVANGIDQGDVAPIVVGLSAGGAALGLLPAETTYATVSPMGLSTAAVEEVEKVLGVEIHTLVTEAAEAMFEGMGAGDTVTVVVESAEKIRELEQAALAWADKKGFNITAKKTEYIFGSRYEGGAMTSLPLVGSLQNIAYKFELSESITVEDALRAGVDVAKIVTLAVEPVGAVAQAAEAAIQVAPVAEAVRVSEVAQAGATWAEGAHVVLPNVVTAGDLSVRFAEGAEVFNSYVAHLNETDASIRGQILSVAGKLKEAQLAGPGAVSKALAQAKMNIAGMVGERFVKDALAPYFERVSTQVTVEIGDLVRRPDLLLEGARRQIIAVGFRVPAEGRLAVEVKTWASSTFGNLREVKHAVEQADALMMIGDQGMVIVSKSINDASNAIESAFRSGIKTTGAHTFKFLPRKEVVDHAVLEIIEDVAKAMEVS